jgi:hypothetical protein
MTDGDGEHAPTISGPIFNGARKEEEEESSEEEVGEEERQEAVVATPLPIADESMFTQLPSNQQVHLHRFQGYTGTR